LSSPSFVLLGTRGLVPDPARFDDDTLLGVLGANSGNLMFQYAASRIIDAPITHISPAETPYSDTSALQTARALVFPAANHLRVGADWTGLNNYLDRAGPPLVILGLGAQSPRIGGEAETIAALKADPHVRRMVDILRDKAIFVSVRGAFSQAVCAELGLPDVVPLGCPSALINPDPGLGAQLAAKLEAARTHPMPQMALTAAAPFEIAGDADKRALEQRLFGWAMETSGLYMQQSGGVAAMNAANGHWYRIDSTGRRAIPEILAPGADPLDVWAFLCRAGRFYLSAPDWSAELAGADFAMGTRLHGNMAAIAAGTPGILVAHDSRTGELGETMHLPGLTMAEVMAAPSLSAALARVRFDPAAFDGWRARSAAALTEAFDRLGIPVAAHVRALAQAASRQHVPA